MCVEKGIEVEQMLFGSVNESTIDSVFFCVAEMNNKENLLPNFLSFSTNRLNEFSLKEVGGKILNTINRKHMTVSASIVE
jgi:hypothetical protein